MKRGWLVKIAVIVNFYVHAFAYAFSMSCFHLRLILELKVLMIIINFWM
jgi:hypothetical protein